MNGHAYRPQSASLPRPASSEGYRVIAASNGRLALEAAHKRKPALIISDVVMPEMTGYELCKQIKGDPQLSEHPDHRRRPDPDRVFAQHPAG